MKSFSFQAYLLRRILLTKLTPSSSPFLPTRASEQGNWASEVSPTQGCSIEISRDICMYIIGRTKRAPHWGVQSRFRVILCMYTRKWFPLQGELASLTKKMLYSLINNKPILIRSKLAAKHSPGHVC